MKQNIYSEIMQQIGQGKSVALRTKIAGEEGLIRDGLTRSLEAVVSANDAKGRRCVRTTVETDGLFMTADEPVLPQERLIILGGGHIALALCETASKCGFAAYVADDRPAFANAARFPWAKGVLCDTFENSIAKLKITPYDYVVIITRGHVHDGDCLRAILPGEQPAYLGLIGSRRRVRGLLAMLAEEGYSKEYMDRICTPIGLNIGAITPEEISISILAELIAYKRLPEHTQEGVRCCNESDLELEMIQYLAENHDPKAIVTVLETKGSTPRGAGAKMTVDPRGQIVGSIGGGCSEGAIIRDAIDIIGSGAYKIVKIDMTGEVAESEGMVCGGTMTVLLEDGTESE